MRVGIVRWNNDELNDPFDVAKIMFDSTIPFGTFSIVNKNSFTVLWSRAISVVNEDQNSQFLKTLRMKVSLSGGPKALYDSVSQKKYQIFFFAMSDDLSAAEHPQVKEDLVLRFRDS